MKTTDGQPMIEKGEMTIENAGHVVVDDGQYLYPGLVPVCAFRTEGEDEEKLVMVEASAIPAVPRGWDERGYAADAMSVIKSRDR